MRHSGREAVAVPRRETPKAPMALPPPQLRAQLREAAMHSRQEVAKSLRML